MKTKGRLFLSLFIVVFMLGLVFPSPAAASTPPIPNEVEVDWEVIITSTYAKSWELRNDEGEVYRRENINDSFSMQASGTTKLERVGLTQDGHPYLEPKPNEKDYSLSCQGGGTNNIWETYTLKKWFPDKGWEIRDFTGTVVTTWRYSMPSNDHPEGGAVLGFEIIPPESDNEPVRYRMWFEPFFFIEYDTLGDYIDVSGEYHSA